MRRLPTYLRVVVATRCNLHCAYCHMEGDPGTRQTAGGLSREDLSRCLAVAVRAGMRKVKFLGGEPLLRADLPEVIADLCAVAPETDLSLITAGVVPVARLESAFGAGLSRMNLSIHGFAPDKLAKNVKGSSAHPMRQAFLEALVSAGRPVKLNYVYGSVFERDDLGQLLAWAAPRGLLVNVLDDLHKTLTPADLFQALRRLRGEPARIERSMDPHSLDTVHWIYADGLRVEIKDMRLGEVAPFSACKACPKRQQCKEGIFALRLTHDGYLQPCMDRPDLRLPLARIVREQGDEAALQAWNDFVEAL